MIIERPLTPVLRLTRVPCPDERGQIRTVDALLLEFDYEGATIPFDDDRQFVRADTSGGPVFIRRDAKAEAVAQAALRPGRPGADANGDGTGRQGPGSVASSVAVTPPKPGKVS